jgi:tungstate transport system permease protein
LPTVVIGLLVYGVIFRRDPFGFADLLFTPSGIVIGLVILALPITAMFTLTAISEIDPRARDMYSHLGLRRCVRHGHSCSKYASGWFPPCLLLSEVGIAVMLGGNIEGYTRTLTTAIALERMKGEFGFGIAIGFLMLAIVFLPTLFSRYVQKL